jgi:NAD(P)-dependent dehydrogenase (short-subunit alcohol dehydrogenase family)
VLAERVALVTGAGRGIGRQIALAFAREGARVAICSRSQAELDEVAEGIAREGGEALAVAGDLGEHSAPAGIVRRVREAWGPVEILVNNAGVGSSANPRPLVDFDDDFWDLSLAVNLTAPYLLSKAVLPEMLRAHYGRILMVASIAGKIGTLHGAAYSASKHGVLGLMRTLALEVAAEGITVNAICPGPVHTVMNDLRIEYDARRMKMPLAELEPPLTPLGRRLEPEEIAPLAVYLASEAAAAVNGQAWNMCGGLLMA